MSEIQEILTEKEAQLLSTGDPLSVQFTVSEINTLSSVNKLRAYKLKNAFPQDFEKSVDVFDCVSRIIEGDSIYRVLEYCMLRNRVLVLYVTSVFKAMKRD